ncbi:MAG: thiamine diphosphokinase, partial [Armatimonadetes bacterium]|nr:thiamine diphosphokinase [Armatimonadota bacterium]
MENPVDIGPESKILIALAGEDLPLVVLPAWLAGADLIIAADGGANLILPWIIPHIVIGDGDSVSTASRESAGNWIHDPDQETTDCDKALDVAVQLGVTSVTLVGVEGDRLDHVLSTLSSCAKSPLLIRLVLRSGLGYVLRAADERIFEAQEGQTISVLPLTESEVSISGVNWPLERQS